MFKSKFLEKLRALPGVNLFNWREKVECEPIPAKEPRENLSPSRHWRQALEYFKRMMLQQKYIETVNKILDDISPQLIEVDEMLHTKELEIAGLYDKIKKLEHTAETTAVKHKKEVVSLQRALQEKNTELQRFRSSSRKNKKDILDIFIMKSEI